MNGRPRPLVHGLAVAVTTSGVGLSINFATDHFHSVLAWTAVAVATFLTGIATGVVERTCVTEPPPAPEILRDRVIIEIAIDPSGRTTIKANAEGPNAVGHVNEALGTITPLLSSRALPKPLVVALVTSRRKTGIARQMGKLERRYAGSGELDVRLCLDNRATKRQATLRTADVVVIDDRCDMLDDGTTPHIRGLNLAALSGPNGDQLGALAIILACHDAAGQEHTAALRRSLDRPVAFLGCNDAVPTAHRGHLYLALLDRLGALAGTHADTEQLRTTLANTLLLVQKERPQLKRARWTTDILAPESCP
ncbi:hypothetical protein [Actinoallomurus soli]|uniref:hypothetical protein n=1 Tax=Actinoallomurus soli TaxID=2952535 RepID=UPI002092F451|nr:hypothetical protein [Actinoallomurus soli]MCO5974811.1 hypothetical protein [Actinoallomurus soli]